MEGNFRSFLSSRWSGGLDLEVVDIYIFFTFSNFSSSTEGRDIVPQEFWCKAGDTSCCSR